MILIVTNVKSQDIDNSKYELTRTYSPVNIELYLKHFKSPTNNLNLLCSDEVLITIVDKNKNKYLPKSEVSSFLHKRYFNNTDKTFKISSETNNGYVLVIGQYGSDRDIPIRYYTIFTDQTTGKINVIEVEENK